MKHSPSPQTIYINGRFLSQPATGVQRYAVELVRAWDGMLSRGEIKDHDWRIELLTPRLHGIIPQFNCIPVRQVGMLQGNRWEQVELPWHARGKFLFNPCNTGPGFKRDQAVTIHDASVFAVPHSYSLAFRIKYKIIISILSRSAAPIFTDSSFSRDELAKFCHVNPGRFQVVPLAADHILYTQPDEDVFQKHGMGSKPFFLAVGSNAPHKNLTVLAQALALLSDPNFDGVIAGGDFKKVFQTGQLASQDALKRIGYVSEGELKALYQRAEALVFPSLYEGFGLPPLEAMACGCPVICAKAASLPEVCGDAALYFNPHDPRDLADKLLALINDRALQDDLRKKGYSQAQKFTWSKTGQQTWAALTSE